MKTDLFPLLPGRSHQLTDSVEDNFELGIIFPIQIIQPARQLGMAG
jgi:hypothetical protein